MTSVVTISNKSDGQLKISSVQQNGTDKPDVSEKLILNREPQEFTITRDRVLVISEADTSDEGDDAKAAALDAAAKEPQRLSEQRNPQVTLGSAPHDPNKTPVAAPTPMGNTAVQQVPGDSKAEAQKKLEASQSTGVQKSVTKTPDVSAAVAAAARPAGNTAGTNQPSDGKTPAMTNAQKAP